MGCHFNLKGALILQDPMHNKGTSFTTEERNLLGLHGLLPPHISTIEEQVKRRYHTFLQSGSDINKYIYLKNLQNRNEVLFYRLALEHSEELLPYIYTPTVGDASLDFSNIYSENRGIYLSYELMDRIDEILSNISQDEIDVIVVTDGSRILGLGDVGIGGMTIPIGKLSLYTLFGGIHPARTLPIILDVGTNNQSLLSDPLYLGTRHTRIEGEKYDEFIEKFIQGIKKRFPKVLLQWEDFSKNHARPLLDRYQDKICSFNDDIQGTASVALAAILSALKSKKEKLEDQKIVIFGGGSAGLGIAEFIIAAMKKSNLSEKELYEKFYIIDIHGLIHDKMSLTDPNQKKFAQSFEKIKSWKVKNSECISLEEVVRLARPTILLGVSAQPRVFTEAIVKTMCENTQAPLIFPLSNPTSKSEADPRDLVSWSKGKAIVATGSPPFDIDYEGRKIPVAQCNNVYVFPGVGLGIIAAKAKKVPNECFLIAASVLSDHSPKIQDPTGALFPRIRNLREIGKKIGLAVCKYLIEQGLSQDCVKNPLEAVEKTQWFPNYLDYSK